MPAVTPVRMVVFDGLTSTKVLSDVPVAPSAPPPTLNCTRSRSAFVVWPQTKEAFVGTDAPLIPTALPAAWTCNAVSKVYVESPTGMAVGPALSITCDAAGSPAYDVPHVPADVVIAPVRAGSCAQAEEPERSEKSGCVQGTLPLFNIDVANVCAGHVCVLIPWLMMPASFLRHTFPEDEST